jgi:hypothetical protein
VRSGRARLASLAGIALAAALGGAPPVHAQGVDQTCQLGLTRFDPDTVNVAFPDDSAQYFSGTYQAVPGTRIRIQGQFPHARYMSFNVYDAAQRPLDALADIELRPDPGSKNPFAKGADRNSPARSYTAYMEFGPTPKQRAPNTLYTGTGQNGLPNYGGTFIYRIYIPDRGRDISGGVGMPTVTLQGADGGPAPPSACGAFSRPGITGVNQGVAALDGFGSTGQTVFDRNPPKWRKFTNLFQAVADNFTDSDTTDPLFDLQRQLDLADRGGSGGFLSNIHNAYLSANLGKAYGEVSVTRFRVPTFPDTRPGTSPMPGGQLRYWSICENDPATQRFIACANDDRAAVGADGFATYVVSTPSNRPANAVSRCGVNWLPFGPNARGVLIYRHMLPEFSFAQSIQRAKVDHEVATMGDYFPVSRYLSKAAYEKLGCPARASGARCVPRRLPVSGQRIGPARLGSSLRPFSRRYGAVQRRGSEVRFCVTGGGRFWVGAHRDRIDFAATTARGHRTRGTGPGRRLPRARISGARRIARGLLVGHRMGGGRVVYGIRRRRVRFLAVVTVRQLKHPGAVVRRLRSVGLR